MAQSTSRKTSITARRTYALLKGALFSQLAALPFEQLTLTDICNTALIAAITIAVKPGQVDRGTMKTPVLFYFIVILFFFAVLCLFFLK